MKVVLFLSRFTLICNIAFLLFIFFTWLELKKPVSTAGDTVLAVHLAKELVIILGISAMIINLIMNIIYGIVLLSGKIKQQPQWLTITNAVFLLLQIYYFFLFKY